MSRKWYSIYAIVLVVFAFQWWGFSGQPELRPTQKIHQDYVNNLGSFQKEVANLQEVALAFEQQKKSLETLREALVSCREAYKRVEFIFEYYDPQMVKDHINGAPLVHQERSSAQPNLLDPEGLQALDELIFSDEAEEEAATISHLSKKLGIHLKSALGYQKSIAFQDRHIFEAVRQELIRMFTLGVSGFDTPGSTNGVQEALASMEQLRTTMNYYQAILKADRQHYGKELAATFDQAVDYLKANRNFEDFDRLHFLTTYINPLYNQVYQVHRNLGIEFIEETTNLVQPVNYHATNIFSEDFLNPYFYSGLYAKEMNDKKIELGRLLFFDPVLSGNNKRSCASCHDPAQAFTDGLDKSLAFDLKGKISRNAPTLINAIYSERYFHDLRADEINNQVEHVVVSDGEFNTTFKEMIGKLKKSSEYEQLFDEAFPELPGDKISKQSINQAMTAFVQEIRSFNSPFDRYVRGENQELSASAKNGFNLFMGKAACATCHFPPTFNGTVPPAFKESESEVLGVPATKDTLNPILDADMGRRGTQRVKEWLPIHEHAFKTPTVRNIELTGPYMHNGVYDTMEEVLDFYNRGGGQGLGLDVPNQTLGGDRLDLTQQEIDDLIAFMKSLSDPVHVEIAPEKLPEFGEDVVLNKRKTGGEY